MKRDKQILVKVDERELFDLIALVYSAGNTAADAEYLTDLPDRRRALFEKLQVAFESHQYTASR